MQTYLTIWDLVLGPVYLLLLIYFAKLQRDKKYGVNHPMRRYYLPGLYVKFTGVIFIALIYQYYYQGGDTFNYLTHSQIINSSLNSSFSTWLNLILHRSPDVDPSMYQYTSQMYWYTNTPAYTVSVIAAIFGLLSGTSYIPISLLFAYLSYTGIWAMYETFAKIYPKMYKPLAYAFLFIPSTFFWGSSLFKDTICMFSLGWMTYCAFRIFVNRDLSIKNFLLLSLSFYLIALIKIYILLAFIPALGLWLLMTYSKNLPMVAKWLVNLVFVGVVGAGFLYAARVFAEDLDEYSLENITKKAQKTQGWITYVSETNDGSAYDIGKIDGTPEGMLSKFPQAVNVTLYRPYLWESKKPIILLSALESTAFLILTIMVFFRIGFFKTFRRIFSDPNFSFFFIYTLVFAFAVGISTGNFGSLSRYKIPCIPFFGALLLLLYYQSKQVAVPSKIPQHAKKPVHHFT